MSRVVSVRSLSVVRGGRHVLRDVDLDVESGSVTGLLGPSGSGKTTLMRAIVGAQVVAGGEVTVLGLPAGTAELRGRVGYQTQAPSVYVDLTVRENLDYFGRIYGVGSSRGDELLALVDLEGLDHRLAGTLSGGELARLSLAAALLNDPELVVLDEPTVGLDPVLRRDLWATFHELAARGTALLVSSHVMDEASRCDAIALLRDGRVLETGTPAELRARAGTDDLDAAFLALVEEGEG